jgi:L-2,4-diaminobutyric acid acetyltransferase
MTLPRTTTSADPEPDLPPEPGAVANRLGGPLGGVPQASATAATAGATTAGATTASATSDTESEPTITIRRPRLERGDGSAMWQLARDSGVLEENAEYTYHMFSHYFCDASVVAEVDGEVAGFIAGFLPPDHPDALFVWQIAVAPSARGMGLASAMIHGELQRLAPDVRYVEATVSPSNEPSQRTFRGVARDLGALCTEEILFPGDRFHGPSHEDEVLFRIGPIAPERIKAHARRMTQRDGRKLVIES